MNAATEIALCAARPANECAARAAALVPELREAAARIDEERRVPADIAARIVEAGLIRVANPLRHGGEGEYDLPLEATYELARGSGSAAWCHAVWSQHNWMIGLWPDEAQSEYFAETPDVLCSSALNPAGAKVTAAPGGYELSGQWSFSSGCDNASWFMLGAALPSGELGFLLLPRSDCTIVDTWHVSGLQGTGSKDIRVDGAFVPRHRSVAAATFTTGSPELADRASYTVPAWSLNVLSLTYAVIGMAQGAVDAFVERALTGGPRVDGRRSAEVPATQLRLAEATAELDAALTLCRADVSEVLSRATAGATLGRQDLFRYARNRAFANKLAVQAVNRIFDVSGASGIHRTSAVQRFHRDAHAGSHQPVHSWDAYGTHYGRVRLGIDVDAAVRLI
jgi:3-hydroxy-9,10-secoandrosta-1,3,5(10)-triene-9,17-dione monooxygenase